MAGVIRVVGVGPGSPDYLMPAALEAVSRADLLVGGHRALSLFAGNPARQVAITGRLEDAIAEIAAHYQSCQVVVLVSGDPGFYSLLPALRHRFPPADLEVIPGISSVQLAFARLKLPWQHATLVSLHGRELAVLRPLLKMRPLAMLTDPLHTPAAIGRYLLDQGAANSPVWVCLDLSYPTERIVATDLQGMSTFEADGNAVVVMADE